MTRSFPKIKTAAKLLVLGATSVLLMATSAPLVPPDCDQAVQPIAFLASGSCGSGGLIVVTAFESDSTVTLANAAALGLPPLDENDTTSASHGQYMGAACPFTLEKGEWSFEWSSCRSPDAGTDAGQATDAARADGGGGAGGGANPMPCLKKCAAQTNADGHLRFICLDSLGATLCESELTKVVTP